ncbi:RnfABCDGE type electron transport complex subunit D [Crenobacter caeni]|uniref:Ion-translocating oxidoreductase complex subunit D n=1 Tax=Crenobacter caeni TaxID=2705474 RepID=A0A6B2KV83_9NEIS|nr:RnfABCDGE type electron transport complex subunit D [Crenobacter caeni]NDV13913.1 RnfABCDGE type electron transport complex subunit D [Crenobacter caeni]
MMYAPYLARPTTVSTVMFKVLAALLPAIATSVWVFGVGVLVQLALASVTALVTEALMLRARAVPVAPFLKDGSALLTAWLLALSMPPLGVWWLIVVATAFAIVFGKQLYGGLGNNPFNPAMVGFAMAIVAFPAQMAAWGIPHGPLSALDQLGWIFARELPAHLTLDAISSATPLDYLKTHIAPDMSATQVMASPLFGHFGGAGSEWVAFAYVAGGLYLLQQKVIAWHTPVAMLGALGLIAALMHLADPWYYSGAPFHLAAGATMLAAFFIVTDPVSAPVSARGRLIFGAGVGVLVYVIRVFGGYPDAAAFSVLLMNIATPLIDRYTRPPSFGAANRKRKEKSR